MEENNDLNQNVASKNHTHTMAVVGLIVNLFIPGLGSIIGGRTGAGIIQLVLTIIAGILCFTVIGIIAGIPLGAAMWIWALVVGINMVKKANPQSGQ